MYRSVVSFFYSLRIIEIYARKSKRNGFVRYERHKYGCDKKISFERHEMNKYIDNNKTGTRESIWILRHFKHNLTRPKPINLFKKNVFVVNNECLKKKLYQLNVLSETSVNYIVLSDITINFDRVEKYERDM